jgi:Tfp pilus assembly protein PilO
MAVHKLIVAETVLRLGKPGLAGALLLAAALVYGLTGVLPAGLELAEVRDRAARAEATLARVQAGQQAVPQTAAGRREAFFRTLPAEAAVTAWIERIYQAAAAEDMSLARGEYTSAALADAPLTRYRIALPVQGDYERIRRFIDAAQAAVPGLGLDDISLQRQAIGDTQVEVRVRFSLYLARP